MSVIAALAFGQNPHTAPSFQIADVHASAPIRNRNMEGSIFRAGWYEIRDATMLDLVKTAYSVDADTVVGGPAWLEFDHFDVIAKAPPATSPETVKLMLQALLADRFKLVVHKDTRPIQGFVLSVGKGKPKLKPADGSGEPGCQFQPPLRPGPDFVPPNVVSCHNVTMEEFASTLRGFGELRPDGLDIANAYLTGPVLNSTGLKGAWDFNFKWTSKGLLRVPGADGVTIFDAVDKQLGLKLEPGKVLMPVLVVDNANETPTANSPEVTTALPPPPPVEFEVASVRLSKPGADEGDLGEFLPGGRYEAHGEPLFDMLIQAWDINRFPGDIPAMPKWLTRSSPIFDIVAKAPPTAIAIAEGHGVYDLQSMMRALLVDRFKMKAHYEDRPMDAYTLVADKPKLKKADPSNRTACKTAQGPRNPDAGPPPMIATCQNITTAQFAEQLQTIARLYLRYPVSDASGIEGSWDFSLSFSPVPPNLAGGGGGGNGGGKGGGKGGGQTAGVSSDPSGAVSLFDALDKQLGLKLEVHKRPEPVLVIDHIEESPTDN